MIRVHLNKGDTYMETPELSAYQDNLLIVQKAVSSEGITASALQKMDNHQRDLLSLLHELVDTGSLNMPSNIAIDALTAFGVINRSQPHTRHIQMLSDCIYACTQPQNAQSFYAIFSNTLTSILIKARASTELADKTRLFTMGLLDNTELDRAYAAYTDAISEPLSTDPTQI
jgi:hypothetical protein